ncbi:hypothetical protein [Paenibacillus tundrae]
MKVYTLHSMLSILHQAKQYEAEFALSTKQSLGYVSSLVESMNASAAKRKNFVSAKLKPPVTGDS